MNPKLERAEAEAREKLEADAEAETRRSAKEVAERKRRRESRQNKKTGREKEGAGRKKRESAERERRAMKASCSSSYKLSPGARQHLARLYRSALEQLACTVA